MCCNRCSGMEDRESSPMIMDVNRAAKENMNFDTYNSLTPNWYYKVLR